MANIRTEQEREELHKAIWNMANTLRGSVDGWDFKQYVLGFMFYRYISENIAIVYSTSKYSFSISFAIGKAYVLPVPMLSTNTQMAICGSSAGA